MVIRESGRSAWPKFIAGIPWLVLLLVFIGMATLQRRALSGLHEIAELSPRAAAETLPPPAPSFSRRRCSGPRQAAAARKPTGLFSDAHRGSNGPRMRSAPGRTRQSAR
jgi:hypothetical protein